MDSTFIFKCFKTIEDAQKDTTPDLIIHENDLTSEEIYITVKGCNSANWYVDAENGNDTNNGNSKTTAFKTLKQALSHVEGEKTSYHYSMEFIISFLKTLPKTPP